MLPLHLLELLLFLGSLLVQLNLQLSDLILQDGLLLHQLTILILQPSVFIGQELHINLTVGSLIRDLIQFIVSLLLVVPCGVQVVLGPLNLLSEVVDLLHGDLVLLIQLD